MILKAKERGDGGQLARYLLTTRDNEHVELHQVKGSMSHDLIEAFHEADAIARGTRCKNYLFSMSLNPAEDAHVSTEVFDQTADAIGEKLGLENQPRAIVFHEKMAGVMHMLFGRASIQIGCMQSICRITNQN